MASVGPGRRVPDVRRFFVPTHRVRACPLLVLLASSPAVPAPAADGDVLEEIVVTARKIEESLLSVPMSIQVLSGEYVDSANVTSLYTLQYSVPGLVVANHGMFGATMSLRGITNVGGSSQSVATHLNGVYLNRSDLALARMFDVERIEILKGPQGTLYGRNSTAGAINQLPHAPEDTFGASFESAVGSFDTARAEGQVNFAGRSMAARFAAVGSGGEGYIRNTQDARRFAEEDYWGLRASLMFRPTAALEFNVMAQSVADDGGAHDLWLPGKDFLPDPEDLRLTTVTDANPYLDIQNDLVSIDATWLFDAAWLQSISGYARNETYARDDCAGAPWLVGCVRAVQPVNYEQWSQEFRLGSPAGSETEWLAGMNVFDGQERIHNYLRVPAFGPEPANDYMAATKESTWGVFGQLTRPVKGRLSLTAGLRYSDESQSVSDVGQGRDDRTTLTTADGEWDSTSWRLGVQFEQDASTLWFASLATGFKSGGVTTVQLADGSFDDYRPETVTAWELGVNRGSPGSPGFITVSMFYNDFEDMQVQTIAVAGDQFIFDIDNAAAARIYGLDLSATASVGNHWGVSGAVVWLPEREFVDFTPTVGNAPLDGNVLTRAPEWSATAAIEYVSPPLAGGNLSARLDFSYRSETFYTKENLPSHSQGAFGVLDLFLRYESRQQHWYLFASARNMLDEAYFDQVFIQTSPGRPPSWEVGFGVRY